MQQTMISIVPDEMEAREAYRLTTSIVTPRPIAWVSTLGSDGTPNLAPFSFFNAIAGGPPTIIVSIGTRKGQSKDTLRNIEETGEFVVHIVTEALADSMNQTSGDWDYDVDEFKLAELETAPSIDVKPPRIAAAPVAMETRLTQLVAIEGSRNTLVVGRIIRFHISSKVMREDGVVSPQLLKPIGRLGKSREGSDEYTTLGKIITLQRPQPKR